MFETKVEPIASCKVFIVRMIKCIFLSVILVALVIVMGMVGYHYTEGMTWLNAFVNSALILSDMGPITPLTTMSGKVFASFYALFCGLAFLSIIGVIFAPVIHRFLHQFHTGGDDQIK